MERGLAVDEGPSTAISAERGGEPVRNVPDMRSRRELEDEGGGSSLELPDAGPRSRWSDTDMGGVLD